MVMQNTEIILSLDNDKTNTVSRVLAMTSIDLSQTSQKSMERNSLTGLDLNPFASRKGNEINGIRSCACLI